MTHNHYNMSQFWLLCGHPQNGTMTTTFKTVSDEDVDFQNSRNFRGCRCPVEACNFVLKFRVS